MRREEQNRRETLRLRAGFACEYCLIPEHLAGGLLTEDHIVPVGLGGTDSAENLCWCCFRCNVHKGNRISGIDLRTCRPAPLFNPRLHRWHDHFPWSRDGGHVLGRTAIGRATVETLKFNLPDRVTARCYWSLRGVHPRDEK